MDTRVCDQEIMDLWFQLSMMEHPRNNAVDRGADHRVSWKDLVTSVVFPLLTCLWKWGSSSRWPTAWVNWALAVETNQKQLAFLVSKGQILMVLLRMQLLIAFQSWAEAWLKGCLCRQLFFQSCFVLGGWKDAIMEFLRWQRDGLFPCQILVFVSSLIANPLKILRF